jgi:hypothetical protein
LHLLKHPVGRPSFTPVVFYNDFFYKAATWGRGRRSDRESRVASTTLREKSVKIGAKVVNHARHMIFQMDEVAVPKELFEAILERLERLKCLALCSI